ncbi:MAG: glutamate 5-kinase [Erysipelotrichaceae bacterium]|nr:glutamate 5-kinase [Erysipelotrichaceae bacterium]
MRIVIKIGTSNITYKTGNLNIRHVENMCRVFSDIKNSGHELIIVSSGAIGMGVGKLSLKKRPDDIAGKQAAASVGQCELMYTYDKLFGEYNHTVGQILLTADDVKDEKRVNNFKNTIERLLEFGAIPIINENDTIAVDEITIGDNDTLSAIVASHIDADLLILMSDIDGLYTKNPKKYADAKKIDLIEEITDEVMALADGKGTELSTGGMATKLKAAKIVTEAGCDMVIINGEKIYELYDLLEGKNIGTRFTGKK